MTLIVGAKFNDFLILAADDYERNSPSIGPSTSRVVRNKIKKVGRDCSIGFLGDIGTHKDTISMVLDEYSPEDDIDCKELCHRLVEFGNSTNLLNPLSFVVAGFTYPRSGKRLSLFSVNWLERPGIHEYIGERLVTVGVTAFYDLYLHRYLPLDDIVTVKQATNMVSILIHLNGLVHDAQVGRLGCVAIFDGDECTLLDTKQQLNTFLESGELSESNVKNAIKESIGINYPEKS